MKISKELRSEIEKRLTPEIGQAIVDATDLIMRLRLGQLNIVADILKRHCTIHEESKGPDIEGPLYKALELGEFMQCLKENPNCKDATECWITRKGFAPCRNKVNNSRSKKSC